MSYGTASRLGRFAVAAAMMAAALGWSGAARADYPERAVTVLVPYPPGGTSDIVARLVSARLTEKLGKPFVVQNKGGAGGQIGTQEVARAKPDGYTLLLATINTHGINAALYEQLPYRTIEDFAPVTLVVDTPNVILANKDAPFQDLKGMIAYARAHPEALNFGSTSMGGSPHMSGELLKTLAGIDMVHVPYQGGGPMLNDLISGQIMVGFDNLPSSAGHLAAGSLRGLAVTTRERWPTFKDLPTAAEQGVEGYEVAAWFGLLAPAGTPRDAIDTVQQAVAEIVREPAVAKRLEGLGARPVASTPQAFADRIREEVARWTKVVKANGLQRM